MDPTLNRRAILASLGGVGIATVAAGPSLGCSKKVQPSTGSQDLTSAPVAKPDMPMRPLGKTGVQVSLVGLGGAHLGQTKDEAEAIRIVRSALDRGVNFLDNCWDYNDGKSEERMGKALRDGYRKKAFLMTKLDGRTKQSALEQLEQSLGRLQTDMIDLVQIHEVIRPDDPERSFRAGGCIEALLEARKAGKLRYIGFTGHKDPAIHLAMIQTADAHGFTFDTVQMPLNVLDAHFRSFEQSVLPVAVAKGMGVLAMKCMGAGAILDTKVVTPMECLHYAMSLPVSVVITGCDSMKILDQAIVAAQRAHSLSDQVRNDLLNRTREVAMTGTYEKFKTSERFDGTTKNPKWLEKAEL